MCTQIIQHFFLYKCPTGLKTLTELPLQLHCVTCSLNADRIQFQNALIQSSGCRRRPTHQTQSYSMHHIADKWHFMLYIQPICEPMPFVLPVEHQVCQMKPQKQVYYLYTPSRSTHLSAGHHHLSIPFNTVTEKKYFVWSGTAVVNIRERLVVRGKITTWWMLEDDHGQL